MSLLISIECGKSTGAIFATECGESESYVGKLPVTVKNG